MHSEGDACIGMGSNLGDRQANLEAAIRALADEGVRVCTVSGFIPTEPVGPQQPEFLNAAAMVTTELTPVDLLDALLRIEQRLGRVRTIRWGPRIIDLDLLLFGDQVIQSDRLIVPHPLMHCRRFVLEPLAEIAPEWRHPVLGVTIRQLLDGLPK